MHLAESSVWLLIASVLATLKISKAVDEHGNVIEPEVKYLNPIFRCISFSLLFRTVLIWLAYRTPSQFKYDMRPRSEKALGLIKMTDGVMA
jgi:hypothetical protein